MRYFLIAICFCLSIQNFAQKHRYDLGFIGGTAYYLGDVNPSQQFYQINPAFGGVFRYTLNYRYAFRASLLFTTLSGDDSGFSSQFNAARGHSFSTFITEATAQAEFSYHPFETYNDDFTGTPYLASGISGIFVGVTDNPVQLAIPMAVGYKLNINQFISTGIEYGFRKTFTDQLDQLGGIDNIPGTLSASDVSNYKQTGFSNNNDWYSYLCIFITFRFSNKKELCIPYQN